MKRLIEQARGPECGEFLRGTIPHVWIGTSVENPEQADKRIPLLLDVPAGCGSVVRAAVGTGGPGPFLRKGIG